MTGPSVDGRKQPESGQCPVCQRLLLELFLAHRNQTRHLHSSLQELEGEVLSALNREELSPTHRADGRNALNVWIKQQDSADADRSSIDVCLSSNGNPQVRPELRLESFCVDGGLAAGLGQGSTTGEYVGWAMENRLRFETLLTDLSSRFVNQPAHEITPLLDESLQLLVEFLGNDRTTLVVFGDDPDHVSVINSYSVDGCEPFPIGLTAVSRLPWFIGTMRSGETIFVRNTASDLPPGAEKERAYCARHGLRSNVALPLKVGGKVLGGLTFAFFRQTCDWPLDVLARLQLIAEVFANALMRQRVDEELRLSLEENQRLREQLEQENSYLRARVSLKHQHGRILGGSEAITGVLADAECVAVTEAPVLLLGETGTGKELLSQTIHDLSRRRSRAMVVVNCASLPATLIESELFGHAAGAYTGAASAQVGHFQLADGSTLFLDEVGELPIELQAKLLRVLEDGSFHRLGSPETIRVDVRIIAATNRDLLEAIRQGKFREDLYHRLNVFPIHLPPLRERREDIPLLVWAFAETSGQRMGKAIKRISHKTMNQLQNYDWPGNVRELSNVIERAIILAKDDVLHVSLPEVVSATDHEPVRTLEESQHDQIVRVLDQTGWRIRGPRGAAEILEIKPTTLEARMAKLGIRRRGVGDSV